MSDHETATTSGLSIAALVYGLFVLVVLLALVGGFGIGTAELVVWLLLVLGWVSLWMLRRRR